MKVHIVVPSELKEYYTNIVENGGNHQYKGDNGIDIPFPQDYIFVEGQTTKVNLGIKVSPQDTNKGLDLRPRSSIGNVPLILTNSVGLIDNNYRGPVSAKLHYPIQSNKLHEINEIYNTFGIVMLIQWFFWLIGWNTIGAIINFILIGIYKKNYNLSIRYKHFKKGDSILQLVAPDTEPIELVIVDELDETERGDGAFGSSTTNKSE